MMRTVMGIALAVAITLVVALPAASDECYGLNRWDCNQQPSCITFHGDTGECYFVYHSYCECRALWDVLVDFHLDSVEFREGQFNYSYYTDQMQNNYDPGSGGCTSYSAQGPDAVAYVVLAPGGTIEAHMQPTDTGHDSSIYLVTDPDDPANTCVAGSDVTVGMGEESLFYESVGGGIYYIIFDAYSSAPPTMLIEVWGEVIGSLPTAVESSSWGGIKALYR